MKAPPNSSGVSHVYVLRWGDHPKKDRWGICINYNNKGFDVEFIGTEKEATDAMLAELKKLET